MIGFIKGLILKKVFTLNKALKNPQSLSNQFQDVARDKVLAKCRNPGKVKQCRKKTRKSKLILNYRNRMWRKC